MNLLKQRRWTLDLETYYKNEHGGEKYTLSKLSTVEYIKDERWKVHGLAVTPPGGKPDFVPESQIQDVLNDIQPKDLVVGHNLAFDGLAFAHHYGFVHWNLIDTLLLANAVLGPATDRGRSNSLGDLAEELGLESKGRLDPMEGVRDLSQEQWDYLALYAKGDLRITDSVLELLLPRLSRPGFELWVMRHSLNIFIHRSVNISDRHLQDAIEQCGIWKAEVLGRVMKPTVGHRMGQSDNMDMDEYDIPPVITDEKQLTSQPQFAAILKPLCAKHKLPFPTKKSPTSGEQIPALAKKDEGLQALHTCGIQEIEDLVSARLVQRSSATVMARLKGLLGTTKAHMSLTYHGACTGRWTGGGNGWNPQNIPSAGRAVSDVERQMAMGIRSCLRPDPGYVFVTVDASQIEARVLGWLAGQWDIVEAFGEGVDLYSAFISDVMGTPVYKPEKGDSQYDYMTALRNVGKECILGLGYSMGWFKLFNRIKEHPQAGMIREALGPRLNAAFIKELVYGYRDKYDCIPQLWDDFDTAFHIARKGGNRTVGPIDFRSEKMCDSLHIILPSGRRIRYSNFRKAQGNYGYPEWVYGRGRKIYGGLVTENVDQGLSRDHLAECIYAAEKMDYPVYLTVHDSIMAHVKKNRADQCLADIVGMLSESPSWGPELRLDAEGHIAEDFN